MLAVLALAVLLRPRSALSVMPRVERAATCEVICSRGAGVTEESEPLSPEQMTALRAALAETTLRWSGRRPGTIRFGWETPLYRLLLDDPGHFEMVDSRVYYDGWSYRLPETDAQRLSERLDSFFA